MNRPQLQLVVIHRLLQHFRWCTWNFLVIWPFHPEKRSSSDWMPNSDFEYWLQLVNMVLQQSPKPDSNYEISLMFLNLNIWTSSIWTNAWTFWNLKPNYFKISNSIFYLFELLWCLYPFLWLWLMFPQFNLFTHLIICCLPSFSRSSRGKRFGFRIWWPDPSISLSLILWFIYPLLTSCSLDLYQRVSNLLHFSNCLWSYQVISMNTNALHHQDGPIASITQSFHLPAFHNLSTI